LTGDQQEVIILKFVDGLSNTEVAQILGKSEGAIKSLQHRALNSLNRILRGRPDFGGLKEDLMDGVLSQFQANSVHKIGD